MTKEKLIESLIKEGYLKTPAIIEAFQKIDRVDFIPESQKNNTYLNQPLPIGFGQTISQPLTVAFMLELLVPKAGDKILDIGAGLGWQTALLASLTGEQGKVIAIERIGELKRLAESNVSKYDFLDKGTVKIIEGDGSKGYEPEAPYDKIIAAAAGESVPQAWKDQLKIGGRIVAPIGQSIFSFDKISADKFSEKQYFGFSFVPLIKD